LREVGKIDGDFLLLGIGVEYLGMESSAADLQDFARIQEYGMIRALWINEQVMFEELHVAACAMNRGVTVQYNERPAAAVDADFVTTGQPGAPGRDYGLALPAFSRIYVRDGQTVKAEVAHNAAANLTAAQTLRVHLFGVEIRGASRG
jgi:hypothetical protein